MVVGHVSRLGVRCVVEWDGGAADNEGSSDLGELDALAQLVRGRHADDWLVVDNVDARVYGL